MPAPPDEALARHPLIDALMDQRSIAVGVVDRDLRYVRLNEALAAFNGAPVDAHLGRTVGGLLPAASAAQVEALLREVLAGRALVDQELAAAGRDCVERLFTFSYLPILGDDGVVGVLALIVDSSARSRAEAELATARRRLYLALEGTNTGTFEYDIATGAVQWSDNLGPLFGRPRGWSPASYE